jgi:type I restriction enzyme S subunit
MTTQMFRIQDLCDIVRGRFPTLKTEPGQYPMVVTAAQRRSAGSFQLDGPAVCIPLISSTGHGHASMHRIHYQEGQFALANLLVALVPKDRHSCDARFLYHLLNAKKDQLFVPLMSGTANVSLKEGDIANVEVQLPSFKEQQSITRWIDDLVKQVEEVQAHHLEIQHEARALIVSALNQIVIGAPMGTMRDVAPIVRRPVDIETTAEYPELGIRSFGKGTFHKPILSGADVGSKRLYRIEPGDLLFSNVFAWEGAVAVAGPQDAGRFGSHRFIACVPRRDVMRADFLKAYFLSESGLAALGEASPGGAGRNRTLGVESLLGLQVPVPTITQQNWFGEIQMKIEDMLLLQRQSSSESRALLASAINSVLDVI